MREREEERADGPGPQVAAVTGRHLDQVGDWVTAPSSQGRSRGKGLRQLAAHSTRLQQASQVPRKDSHFTSVQQGGRACDSLFIDEIP